MLAWCVNIGWHIYSTCCISLIKLSRNNLHMFNWTASVLCPRDRGDGKFTCHSFKKVMQDGFGLVVVTWSNKRNDVCWNRLSTKSQQIQITEVCINIHKGAVYLVARSIWIMSTGRVRTKTLPGYRVSFFFWFEKNRQHMQHTTTYATRNRPVVSKLASGLTSIQWVTYLYKKEKQC